MIGSCYTNCVSAFFYLLKKHYICKVTINDLFEILRKVVIESGDVHMFATLDKSSDWDNNSLNKGYEQSRLGYYWTRRGISRNENETAFPSLVLEWKQSRVRSIDKREVHHEVWLTFSQVYNDDKPERPWELLDYENAMWLANILQRAREYCKFDDGWWHPSVKQDPCTGCIAGEDISLSDDNSMYSSEISKDNLRSKTMKVVIEERMPEMAFGHGFEYTEEGLVVDMPPAELPDIPPVPNIPSSGSVMIRNTDGGFLYEVACGEEQQIEDALVRNSDNTWSQGVLAEGTLVLDDIDIELEMDGDVVFSGAVPYKGTGEITINI